MVVGGGEVGLEKVEGLLACAGEVTLIAPERRAGAAGATRARARSAGSSASTPVPADLEGVFMAIAATDDTEVEHPRVGGRRAARDARQRRRRAAAVQLHPARDRAHRARSRSRSPPRGASPALAKRMKREIAALFGEEYARLAVLLNDVRGWAKDTLPTYAERRDFFEGIVNGDPDPIALLRAGEEAAVRELIERAQRTHALQTASA